MDTEAGGANSKSPGLPRSARIWIALGVSILPFIVCVLHGYAVDCDSKYPPDFCGMTTMNGYLYGTVGSMVLLLISLPLVLIRSARSGQEE